MRVGCGFLSFFARTPQNAAANNTGRKNHRTRLPGESTRDQGPTNRPTYTCLTRDFSTLTCENATGQVDLTRMKPASRGSPGLWRVGSGRVGSGGLQNLAGRVGSIRFSNLAGRVGSGQEVFKISRVGSDRAGSRRLEILAGRVGSDQDVSKFSRVGPGQPTRPDPTRPARFDPIGEKPCKKTSKKRLGYVFFLVFVSHAHLLQ